MALYRIWDLKDFVDSTQVPVVTNSLGGILVGLVTKYSGGVKKVSIIKTLTMTNSVMMMVMVMMRMMMMMMMMTKPKLNRIEAHKQTYF